MISNWEKNRPTAVYRHINDKGETIYIGCSCNPPARTAGHEAHSGWLQKVVRIDIVWFDNWYDARDEEKRLISAEKPPFNVHHTRDLEASKANRKKPGPKAGTTKCRICRKLKATGTECQSCKMTLPMLGLLPEAAA